MNPLKCFLLRPRHDRTERYVKLKSVLLAENWIILSHQMSVELFSHQFTFRKYHNGWKPESKNIFIELAQLVVFNSNFNGILRCYWKCWFNDSHSKFSWLARFHYIEMLQIAANFATLLHSTRDLSLANFDIKSAVIKLDTMCNKQQHKKATSRRIYL